MRCQMNKINPEFLKRNVYEYLKYCHQNRTIRGAGIITSKQFVFYSQVDQYDYKTHDEIQITLEQMIHPILRTGWDAIRPYDTCLVLIGKDIFFYLPDTQELTYAQFEFLSDVLDQIEKYNQEVSPSEHARLICYKQKELDTTNVESMREKLKGHITEEFTLESEIIEGKTLTKEQIIKTMKDQLSLTSCKTIKDLVFFINRCETYQNDSYFQPFFEEIFKDYQEIKHYIEFLEQVCKENTPITITKDLKETLLKMINQLFYEQTSNSKRIKFLKQMCRLNITLKDFTEQEEIIRLWAKYQIEDKSGPLSYEEFSQWFFEKTYEQMLEDLTLLKKSQERLEESLKKYKLQENIWKEKDSLSLLVEEKKKIKTLLETSREEDGLLTDTLERNDEKIARLNQKLTHYSSNILKRILYIYKRKKLNNVKTLLEEENKNIEVKRINLQEEREMLEQKTRHLQEALYQKGIDINIEELEFHLMNKKEPDTRRVSIIQPVYEHQKQQISELETEITKISQSYLLTQNTDAKTIYRV